MTCPTPLSGISVESSVETLVPRRQTFYGMDEVFVRAPCGTLVGLAAKTEGAEAEGAGPGRRSSACSAKSGKKPTRAVA